MLEDWPQPGEIVIVLKEVKSGRIVGPSAPFWPQTVAVLAVLVDGCWREVQAGTADRRAH